jgi:7 transmembrane receptor (rhodopsin family)
VSSGKKFRKELKAVRLTASIVGVFIILWMPYIAGRIIQASGANPLLGQYVSNIGIAMGNFNSCINWVIYGLVSRDFRRAVWKLFMPQLP